MSLFRRARAVLARHRAWSCLMFLYVPLVLVVVNSFNPTATFGWPPPGFTLQWWSRPSHTRRPRRPVDLGQGGRRDRDRAGARHAGSFALQRYRVLRPRRDLAAGHPADRAARHRHRHRAEHGSARCCGRSASARPLHGRRRRTRRSASCRLQQRRWPGCAGWRPTSRRRRPTSAPTLPDVPASDVPADAFGAAGRRAAGVRASASTRSWSPRSPPGRGETLPIWIFDNLFRPNQAPVVNVVGRGPDRAVHRAGLARPAHRRERERGRADLSEGLAMPPLQPVRRRLGRGRSAVRGRGRSAVRGRGPDGAAQGGPGGGFLPVREPRARCPERRSAGQPEPLPDGGRVGEPDRVRRGTGPVGEVRRLLRLASCSTGRWCLAATARACGPETVMAVPARQSRPYSGAPSSTLPGLTRLRV